MANPLIQKMLMEAAFKTSERKRMMKQAAEIGQMAPELFGQQAQEQVTSPYEMSPQELFPGETQESVTQVPGQATPNGQGGLMNIDQAAQAATGLFNQDVDPQERFTAYNQRLFESGMPSLQKQGLEGISQLQASALADTGASGVRAARLDPNSAESKRVVKMMNERYPDQDFSGQSAQTIRDSVQSLQSGQRIIAKPEAADALAASQKELADIRSGQRKSEQANKVLMTQYGEELDQSKKYPGSIANVDRLQKLIGTVETGKLSGSAPAVYLRELFGDTDLQEMKSLLLGLPLPMLRPIFGAAFTVKEGETLAKSLANVGMDAPAFEAAMARLKKQMVWDESSFRDKEQYLRENNGNLVQYDAGRKRKAYMWALKNQDTAKAKKFFKSLYN